MGWECSQGGYYTTRNCVIGTGQMVWLGEWNVGCYDGLGMQIGWVLHDEELWLVQVRWWCQGSEMWVVTMGWECRDVCNISFR